MMQTIHLQSAWKKTIAEGDLNELKALLVVGKTERFIPYRQAFNHQGDLLVTVLIQNLSSVGDVWDTKLVAYVEEGKTIAECSFSIDTVPPNTSMPWTFIFPKDRFIQTPMKTGKLEER
ncbi:SLAP domain-containing protein [Shouchella lehensis]|nr:SLAP domain-containing protein [Shouchella lehensis]RQW22399.1 SLAP domain-containing protein [Bacillus sp. C1-1]TES49217.1 SLAP domain-containing protein [Shouchella lehensis]